MGSYNKRLKWAIVDSGQTGIQIAALAKMHHTRLSQIVRGHVSPNESERLRIAGVLRQDPDWLFASDEVTQ